MRAQLLTFNIPAVELGRLRYLSMRLQADLHPMDAAACALPLKDAGKARIPTYVEEPLPFSERLLVLCGLEGGRLNQALDSLHETGMPALDYKAVLTPTNRNWTAIALIEALRTERAAMEQAQSAVPTKETTDREE